MCAAAASTAFLLVSWLATADSSAMHQAQQQAAARSLQAGGGGSAFDRLMEDPSGWIPDLHSPGATALGRPSTGGGNSSSSAAGVGPQLPPGDSPPTSVEQVAAG
jgi:hypothetical protein